MIFIHDDLWRHPGFPGIIAVTTNSIAKRDGSLVMGRGSAGDAARRIPNIAFECASAILYAHPHIRLDGTQDYGFLVVRPPREDRVGFAILQAKRHWRDVSDIHTIMLSVLSLRAYLMANPTVQVRTVFPGGGCGQIGNGTAPSVDEIAMLLRPLPDNLTVCIRPGDTALRHIH